MWSPESVNKIFPLQQNTNEKFWSQFFFYNDIHCFVRPSNFLSQLCTFSISTFWRRNVPDGKTAVWFFALCLKRSSFCVQSRRSKDRHVFRTRPLPCSICRSSARTSAKCNVEMFRLHFVINYGKISEYLWTPHRLERYSRRKNARGLLSCVLSTDRIEIHQSHPTSMTLRRSEGHTSGSDWQLS